jgi:hypothetical protein
MTQAQERDECMWELAYRLARSGVHRSYQSIESELSGLGYRKARSLLDDETARERLDRMCAGARKAFVFVSAQRFPDRGLFDFGQSENPVRSAFQGNPVNALGGQT